MNIFYNVNLYFLFIIFMTLQLLRTKKFSVNYFTNYISTSIYNPVFKIYIFNITALSLAVENEFEDIVQLLLSHPKIDVNIHVVLLKKYFNIIYNSQFKLHSYTFVIFIM